MPLIGPVGRTAPFTNLLTNPSVETDLSGWVLNAPAYFGAVLADSPTSYWRLDETSGTAAADVQGAHAGTYAGSPVLGVAGALADGDKAVNLNNAGRVTTTYTPFVSGAKTTVEGIAYASSSPASKYLFGSSASAGPQLFFDNATQVSFYPKNAAAASWAGAWPGTAQWVHWLLNFDDAAHTAELFINGVSQGAKSGLDALATIGNFQIGSQTNGFQWPGYMDEVAVYAGVNLSSARAAAHFAAISQSGHTGVGGETTFTVGAATLAQSSAWSSAGSKSARLTVAGSTAASTSVDSPSFAVTASASYSGSLAYNAGTVTGGSVVVSAHYSDGSSSAMGTISAAGAGTITSTALTAAGTAATLRAAPNAAGTFDVSFDAGLVVAGTVLPTYFDGDTPGYAWTGTSGASTSASALEAPAMMPRSPAAIRASVR